MQVLGFQMRLPSSHLVLLWYQHFLPQWFSGGSGNNDCDLGKNIRGHDSGVRKPDFRPVHNSYIPTCLGGCSLYAGNLKDTVNNNPSSRPVAVPLMASQNSLGHWLVPGGEGQTQSVSWTKTATHRTTSGSGSISSVNERFVKTHVSPSNLWNKLWNFL